MIPAKIIRVPKTGLHWTQQYAKVGDTVRVYPFFGPGFLGCVEKVSRNRMGRISYCVDGRSVFTEELTPLHHAGVRAAP